MRPFMRTLVVFFCSATVVFSAACGGRQDTASAFPADASGDVQEPSTNSCFCPGDAGSASPTGRDGASADDASSDAADAADVLGDASPDAGD